LHSANHLALGKEPVSGSGRCGRVEGWTSGAEGNIERKNRSARGRREDEEREKREVDMWVP
jgi:hypothetical protein